MQGRLYIPNESGQRNTRPTPAATGLRTHRNRCDWRTNIKTLGAGLSEMTTRNRSSPHSAPNSRVARIPIRDIDVRSRMTLNVPSRLRHACEGRILPTVRRWAWVPRNPSPSSYLEPSGQPRTAETIREYGQLHDIHVRSHRTLNVRLHQLQPDVLPQPSQT